MSRKTKAPKNEPPKDQPPKDEPPESARPKLDPRLVPIALFVAIFVAATGVHFLLQDRIAPVLNEVINGRAAAFVINLLTPSANVHCVGSIVEGPGAAVMIKQGCDGLDALLMLVAAVLAFPMPARRKLAGAAIGAALVYSFNVLRIAVLWYCARYWPAAFDTMHIVVGQTILIALAMAFFVVWTRAAGGPGERLA
jgi:exosortase family protein XrtM